MGHWFDLGFLLVSASATTAAVNAIKISPQEDSSIPDKISIVTTVVVLEVVLQMMEVDIKDIVPMVVTVAKAVEVEVVAVVTVGL